MSRVSKAEIRDRIRESADNRCGYCQSPQHLVLGPLEIEHLLPTSLGGTDDESNLWLACRMCNNFKGAQVTGIDSATQQVYKLFNPRDQNWPDHFGWSIDGKRVVGLTQIGRATVDALQLNNLLAITVRENWISAGWHPPKH